MPCAMIRRRRPIPGRQLILLPLIALLLAGCDSDSTDRDTPGDIAVTVRLGSNLVVPTGTRLHVRATGERSHPGEQVQALQAGSREWEVVLSPRSDTPVGSPLQVEAWVTDPGGRTLWSGTGSAVWPAGGASLQVVLLGGGPGASEASLVRILGPDELDLVEGDAVGLELEVVGTSPSQVVFASSSPTVAEVDPSGNVVAHQPGTARVYALAGTQLDSVAVRVSARLDRLVVDPTSLVLTALGEEGTLDVRGVDVRGGNVPLPGAVTWSSRDERVVTVDAEGHVVAVAVGDAQVVARLADHPGMEAVATVSVRQQVASLLFVQGAGQEGRVGEPLPVPPLVRLVDAGGHPVVGERVAFQVVTGGGRVVHTSRFTDASGQTGPGDWVLGGELGSQLLRAQVTEGASADLEAVARTGRPARIVAVSPVVQEGEAGRDAAAPPAVRVEDSGGNPVSGILVEFHMLAGAGTITPASERTGADGVVRATRWRLGPVPGSHRVEASLEGVGGVEFVAEVEVGVPAAVTFTEGDGQTATVASVLPVAPQVQVTDGLGNPVPGVEVTFVVAGGGGMATGGVVLTDATGRARVGSWQLGTTAGANTLEASVAAGPSAVASATGVPGPASAPHSSLAVTAHAAGDSTVVATVTVRDAWGNVRTSGGDAVTVSGPLGAASVSDQADGTYQATVTLAQSRLWEALIPLVSEMEAGPFTGLNTTDTPVVWEVTEDAPPVPYDVSVSALVGGTEVDASPTTTTVIPANFPDFRVTNWWVRSEAQHPAHFALPESTQEDVFPVGDFPRTERTVFALQEADGALVGTNTVAGVSLLDGVLRVDIAGTHSVTALTDGGFSRSGVRVVMRGFRPMSGTPVLGCFQQDIPGSSYWRARVLVDDGIVSEWFVERAGGTGSLGSCGLAPG